LRAIGIDDLGIDARYSEIAAGRSVTDRTLSHRVATDQSMIEHRGNRVDDTRGENVAARGFFFGFGV
jgi:hypothetical protein